MTFYVNVWPKERERQAKKSLMKDKLAALLQNYGKTWEEIRVMDFQTLLERLRSGGVKAIDVLHAFQWRAVHADDKLNCVTEVWNSYIIL